MRRIETEREGKRGGEGEKREKMIEGRSEDDRNREEKGGIKREGKREGDTKYFKSCYHQMGYSVYIICLYFYSLSQSFSHFLSLSHSLSLSLCLSLTLSLSFSHTHTHPHTQYTA